MEPQRARRISPAVALAAAVLALGGPLALRAALRRWRPEDACYALLPATLPSPPPPPPGEREPIRLEDALDPWGHPFLLVPMVAQALTTEGCVDVVSWSPASSGPDGEVDGEGMVDNVMLWGATSQPGRVMLRGAYRYAWAVGLAAALYLLAWARAVALWRSPAPAPEREARRAVLAALPAAVTLGGVAALLAAALGGRLPQPAFLLAPLPVALGGTAAALTVGAAIWLRLRRVRPA